MKERQFFLRLWAVLLVAVAVTATLGLVSFWLLMRADAAVVSLAAFVHALSLVPQLIVVAVVITVGTGIVAGYQTFISYHSSGEKTPTQTPSTSDLTDSEAITDTDCFEEAYTDE